MKILTVCFFVLFLLSAYSAIYHELWKVCEENVQHEIMGNTTMGPNYKMTKEYDDKGILRWVLYKQNKDGVWSEPFQMHPAFKSPDNKYFGKISMGQFGHWYVKSVMVKKEG